MCHWQVTGIPPTHSPITGTRRHELDITQKTRLKARKRDTEARKGYWDPPYIMINTSSGSIPFHYSRGGSVPGICLCMRDLVASQVHWVSCRSIYWCSAERPPLPPIPHEGTTLRAKEYARLQRSNAKMLQIDQNLKAPCHKWNPVM